MLISFNPAEAREWFRRSLQKDNWLRKNIVSIQPKPENGLEVVKKETTDIGSFVSIQPKPENGLEEILKEGVK